MLNYISKDKVNLKGNYWENRLLITIFKVMISNGIDMKVKGRILGSTL